MDSQVRIDKFLWSIRVYKTRSQATEACKKKHVLVNDHVIKPSGNVKKDDIIEVKKPPIIRTFTVLETLSNRVSAKLVSQYATETTPKEEYDKLRILNETTIYRERGEGRPTKKDRRLLEKLNPYK